MSIMIIIMLSTAVLEKIYNTPLGYYIDVVDCIYKKFKRYFEQDEDDIVGDGTECGPVP